MAHKNCPVHGTRLQPYGTSFPGRAVSLYCAECDHHYPIEDEVPARTHGVDATIISSRGSKVALLPRSQNDDGA